MKVLELYKGTGSFGKVFNNLDWNITSLDINKKFEPTIINDIMKWDYKKDFKPSDFDLITASPVCLYWSQIRNTWIGRKSKTIAPNGDVITKQHLLDDIERYGKPMVDKTFEILDYFKPRWWILENPLTSSMWKYIDKKYSHLNFIKNDFDYCKYSNWGYKKPTRFITNYEGIITKRCANDCENIITIHTQKNAIHKGTKELIKGKTRTLHSNPIGVDKTKDGVITKKSHKQRVCWGHNKNMNSVGGGNNRLERYRIPPKLIEELIKPILC